MTQQGKAEEIDQIRQGDATVYANALKGTHTNTSINKYS